MSDPDKKFGRLRTEARNYALKYGHGPSLGFELAQNAFQHAYASAVLAYEEGLVSALAQGYLLEEMNRRTDLTGQSNFGWKDIHKDLYNNVFGGRLALIWQPGLT